MLLLVSVKHHLRQLVLNILKGQPVINLVCCCCCCCCYIGAVWETKTCEILGLRHKHNLVSLRYHGPWLGNVHTDNIWCYLSGTGVPGGGHRDKMADTTAQLQSSLPFIICDAYAAHIWRERGFDPAIHSHHLWMPVLKQQNVLEMLIWWLPFLGPQRKVTLALEFEQMKFSCLEHCISVQRYCWKSFRERLIFGIASQIIFPLLLIYIIV